MSRVGEEIVNPAMGARLRFRHISPALLEFDFFLQPGGVIAEAHMHPAQDERFVVISGAMRGHVAGIPQSVVAGESRTVPAGVPHTWRNAAGQETHLRVQFRPALATEQFFDTVFALARAGRVDARGVPRFPERLVLLAAFSHELRPAAMPAVVHRALAAALAPFGRRWRRSR